MSCDAETRLGTLEENLCICIALNGLMCMYMYMYVHSLYLL